MGRGDNRSAPRHGVGKMTEIQRESDESGKKVMMEIELDDHIANGLIAMVFKTQTSGRKDVWDARQCVKELINRYQEVR
ncbi:MAG: hypothetical protein CMK24_07610 [Porticoccaceae bacterium]|nr:hypothetical protein [Porticoccaceae bacterium]|tara:strand:- start:1812 stop:2048 length:237 start_codon:yes stop_codon:yes gene_type:complete